MILKRGLHACGSTHRRKTEPGSVVVPSSAGSHENRLKAELRASLPA